jgi:hypothetical protein
MLEEPDNAKADFLRAIELGLDPETQASVQQMLSEIESIEE